MRRAIWIKPLSFTQRRRVILVLVGLLAYRHGAAQTWQDDIGYTALRESLGTALPTGAGMTVTLVESSVTVPIAGSSGPMVEYFRPSEEAEPTRGNFAGKVFDFRTGPAGVSWHAERVGNYFFGNNTLAAAGEASVAPRAGTGPDARIIVDQAQHWMDEGALRRGTVRLPANEVGRVVNHSWISEVDATLSASAANEVLRRADFQAARDDVVVIGGVNNGRETAMPEVLASAYNVLAVGVTGPGRYGGHSTGASSPRVDGGGRVKPELVAPLPATSYATAVVSSCATLLRGAALTTPGWEEAAHAEVIRALLLAGARKDRFPAWSQEETRPLDAYYGAGEVNIHRSYQILLAGRRSATPPGAVLNVAPALGWSFTAMPEAGQSTQFYFRIPEGCVAENVCAALVWNREFITQPGETPSALLEPVLANLDLRLRLAPLGSPGAESARSLSGASGSVSHPLEHLFLPRLAAGQYVWEVSRAADDAAPSSFFGLAWHATLQPAAAPTIALTPEDSDQVRLQFAELGASLAYVLEMSHDLNQWEEITTFAATDTQQEWIMPRSVTSAYYRLRHRAETPTLTPPLSLPQQGAHEHH